MNTYNSPGMRRVSAEDNREAAAKFAARIARNQFGRRGDVRVLRQDCHSEDGRLAEYEAFIGLTRSGVTDGRNVRFTVRLES